MLRPDEIFDGTYRVIHEIGKGGTGVVYLAFHLRLQKYVALKKIPISFGEISELRREIDFMKDLHHPYLPQIYDFICREGEVYTVMDYIEGTDFDHIPTGPAHLSEKQIVHWFEQLAEVLRYIHNRSHPIIHSDIKPGNLILTQEGNLCLIDFNIAVGANQQGKVLGYSANFASPEQVLLAQAAINRMPSSITLDGRSDIYSAAAVIYYLMTGVPPVTGQRNPPLSQWQNLPYSSGLKAIVDKAMSFEPNQRYSTADKLVHALQNLVHQAPEYRRYLAAQLLSVTLCGLLAVGGVYCIFRGVGEKNLQEYQQDYSRFYQMVVAEESEEVTRQGIELLNKSSYQGILKKKNGRGAILHAIGDAYYRQGDLTGAEAFYQEAIRVSDTQAPDLGEYYLDYGIVLSENGKSVQAELCREQAEANGVDTEVLQLMEGVSAADRGDMNEARTRLTAVYKDSASDSWRAKACEVLANLPDNGQEDRIRWLEQAQTLEPSASRLRKLGKEYLSDYNLTGSQGMAIHARDCYRQLCAQFGAGTEDRLNYGIVNYVTEQYPDAIYILRGLEQEGKGDYRVRFYLALSYYASGNRGDAAAYCASTQRAVRELPQREKDALSEEFLEDLSWLEHQLSQ